MRREKLWNVSLAYLKAACVCGCMCVDQGGRWSGLACNRLISLVVGDRRPSPNKSPKSRRFGRNGSDHVAAESPTKSIALVTRVLLGHKKDGGVQYA